MRDDRSHRVPSGAEGRRPIGSRRRSRYLWLYALRRVPPGRVAILLIAKTLAWLFFFAWIPLTQILLMGGHRQVVLPVWVIGLVMVVPPVVFLAWAWIHWERMTFTARKALLKRIGVCPACRYRIRGVPRTDDGCTVCPECGAAWRLGPPASD